MVRLGHRPRKDTGQIPSLIDTRKVCLVIGSLKFPVNSVEHHVRMAFDDILYDNGIAITGENDDFKTIGNHIVHGLFQRYPFFGNFRNQGHLDAETVAGGPDSPVMRFVPAIIHRITQQDKSDAEFLDFRYFLYFFVTDLRERKIQQNEERDNRKQCYYRDFTFHLSSPP